MSLVNQDSVSLHALVSELGCSHSSLMRDLLELVRLDTSITFILRIQPLPTKSIEFDVVPLVQRFLTSGGSDRFWRDNPKLTWPKDKARIESLLVSAVWTIVRGFHEGTKMDVPSLTPQNSPVPVDAGDISHHPKSVNSGSAGSAGSANKATSDALEHHTLAIDCNDGVLGSSGPNIVPSVYGSHDQGSFLGAVENATSDIDVQRLGHSLYDTVFSIGGLASSSSKSSPVNENLIERQVVNDRMGPNIPQEDTHKSDFNVPNLHDVSTPHHPQAMEPSASQDTIIVQDQAAEYIEFDDDDHLRRELLHWMRRNQGKPLPGALKWSADRFKLTLPIDAYASEDVSTPSIGKVERFKLDDQCMGWVLRNMDGKVVWLQRVNNFVRGFAQYRGWLGGEAMFTTEPLAYTTRPQSSSRRNQVPCTLSSSLGKRRASDFEVEQAWESEEERVSPKKKARSQITSWPIKTPEDLPGGYPSYFKGTTAGIGQAKDALARSGATERPTQCSKCKELSQACFDVGKCERCLYCIAKFVKSKDCKPASSIILQAATTEPPSSLGKVGKRATRKIQAPDSTISYRLATRPKITTLDIKMEDTATPNNSNTMPDIPNGSPTVNDNLPAAPPAEEYDPAHPGLPATPPSALNPDVRPPRSIETIYNFHFGGAEPGPSTRTIRRCAPINRNIVPTKDDFFDKAKQFWLFNRVDPQAATICAAVYSIKGVSSGEATNGVAECFIHWNDQPGYETMIEKIDVAEKVRLEGAILEVEVWCLEHGTVF